VSAEPGGGRPIKVADVRAAHGFAWVAAGFRLFRQQPLVWTGLTLGWLVMTFGLIMIPFLGSVVASFLQPVFFASFAIAAARQTAGEPIGAGDLFAGFRRNVRALINLGALLLIAEIAIFALMALLGLPLAMDGGDKLPTIADYAARLEGKEWILLVGFVLTALVKGAFWFAPPLIAFHDMPTAHAMRWSVFAALANVGAMIAYGIALMVIFVAAIIPWGLGLLVMMPVMAASTYAGYREVFDTE
jgi:uncharacterized membrane protein